MPPVRLMEILSIDQDMARASADGVVQNISLGVIDEKPHLGDCVIVQAGIALHRIDEKAAEKSLDIIGEITENDTGD
jgi:hydrogenase expression/formation protein HypC